MGYGRHILQFIGKALKKYNIPQEEVVTLFVQDVQSSYGR